MREPNRRCRILGMGSAVPDRILSNCDLERLVDTSDEWITSRTGIKERRIIKIGEKLTDYCVKAARRALEDAQTEAGELDAIFLGTVTGDFRFPATSVLVQSELRAMNAYAMDISATCSGWLYALFHADALIASGRIRKALVMGGEMLTSITDWADRSTCVLFGDAAAAAVVEASDNDQGVLSVHIGSNGDLADLLYCKGGGNGRYLNEESIRKGEHFLRMSGNEVFKHAVRTMYRASLKALELAQLQPDDIDWLITHQANIRIIEATAERLNFPRERVFINIDKYGNTSAASVPLAIDEARRTGRLKAGQTILAVVLAADSLGGARSFASESSCLFRWSFLNSSLGNL
ncbi:MAG: beta-ketoacyl-ACP synthase III [bacterium]